MKVGDLVKLSSYGQKVKSKKHDVYGFGLLLGPNKENPKSWEVRTLTYEGENVTWKTQDVSVKSLKEDWPKLYEWADA